MGVCPRTHSGDSGVAAHTLRPQTPYVGGLCISLLEDVVVLKGPHVKSGEFNPVPKKWGKKSKNRKKSQNLSFQKNYRLVNIGNIKRFRYFNPVPKKIGKKIRKIGKNPKIRVFKKITG